MRDNARRRRFLAQNQQLEMQQSFVCSSGEEYLIRLLMTLKSTPVTQPLTISPHHPHCRSRPAKLTRNREQRSCLKAFFVCRPGHRSMQNDQGMPGGAVCWLGPRSCLGAACVDMLRHALTCFYMHHHASSKWFNMVLFMEHWWTLWNHASWTELLIVFIGRQQSDIIWCLAFYVKMLESFFEVKDATDRSKSVECACRFSSGLTAARPWEPIVVRPTTPRTVDFTGATPGTALHPSNSALCRSLSPAPLPLPSRQGRWRCQRPFWRSWAWIA